MKEHSEPSKEEQPQLRSAEEKNPDLENMNITIGFTDQDFQDLRTFFGMCHERHGDGYVFKCATVCADLLNCPSKVVPKGWDDARKEQITCLQKMLSEANEQIQKLQAENDELKKRIDDDIDRELRDHGMKK